MTVDPNLLLDGTAITTDQHKHKKELAGKNDAPRRPPIKTDFLRIGGGCTRAMGSPPRACTILNPEVAATAMCDHGSRTKR